MATNLDLGELRIGEVDLLLEAIENLPAEAKKNVLYMGMLKKLRSLKALWEKTEKNRKNQRQQVLTSRAIKSKTFKPSA